MKRRPGEPDWRELKDLAKDAGLDLDRLCETFRADPAGWPGCTPLRGVARLVFVQVLGAKLRDVDGLQAPLAEACARLGVSITSHRRAITRIRSAARRYVAKERPSDKSGPVLSLSRRSEVA